MMGLTGSGGVTVGGLIFGGVEQAASVRSVKRSSKRVSRFIDFIIPYKKYVQS